VHSAFNVVIWVVCVLAVLIALGVLIASRSTWEDFGKGRLVMDRDSAQDSRPDSGAADAERDAEIRQLLEARNERRARRGEPPIDVEQELVRLTTSAPAFDPVLREEIRQLVVARNHRRVRAGKPPLDVEAEIEREIAELGGL
jgi:sRNA-binding carbon storage regulator CsrA